MPAPSVAAAPNASTPLLRDTWPEGRDDDDEATPVLEVPPSTVLVIMCTSWLGIFIAAMDATVVATLAGPISSDLRSLSTLSWIATAYLVGSAASQPLCGRLTDVLGRGPGLVASHALFASGNLACGLARGPHAMVLGRAVAGVGGGGLTCIAALLASDLIPLRRRGVFQGVANLWYGAGAMVGGVAGGLLYDRTALGWRWAFLAQVPPSVLCAAAAWLLVGGAVPPKQSDRSLLARIDYTGALLTVSFVVLLLLGLSAGVPWTHPLPLTAVPLALLLLAAFVWWEGRRAAQPIIPVRLLGDPTVLAACGISALSVGVMMAALFYVPLYLQVRGETATMAGVKLLCAPASMPLGAMAVGYTMTVTGRYVGLTAASILVMGAGVAVFTAQHDRSSHWLTYTGLFLLGGGYTGVLTTTQIACIAAVEHAQQAVVTSAMYLARSLGGTIGLAVASAVYQNALRTGLWQAFEGRPDAGEQIRRILDHLGYLEQLPPDWRAGATKAFMDAFHATWLAMLVWAVLNLVCVYPMKNHKLHSTLKR
ncbi:MFS multidrug transporter [Cordyceps militaris]|uniref:MFS multidrug transporter n=1 Tax=Cordyceps militaris TaxID=73501 RepID=A0A2H4SA19_CORMI|nr:MFS multidrug transporter [Cordyceps militaris]